MGNQTINIQTIKDGAVVNFYNNDGDLKDKDNEEIRIAATDKYSSAMCAKISISPWGDGKMKKVAMLLENSLISLVIEQSHLVFETEKKAREIYAKIIDTINFYKKEAEIKLIHSSIVAAQIRQAMRLIEKTSGALHRPESDDLLIRFQGENALNTPGIPNGLLTYDPNHFPSHNGIVKSASLAPISGFLKIASLASKSSMNAFNSILEKWSNKEFDTESYFKAMAITANDSHEERLIKRYALSRIRPLYASNDENWAIRNADKIEESIDDLGKVTLIKSEESRVVDFNSYDTFIFDADKTIWECEIPAGKTLAPYKKISEDIVEDSNGNKFKLRDGIEKIIKILFKAEKELGVVSRSEKKDERDYSSQPVILLLKEFGLLPYFKKMIAIAADLPKSMFVNDDRTIFIDDELENLEEVEEHSDADVIDAKDLDLEEIAKDIFGEDKPVEVIELKEGETPEDFKGWAKEDEVVAVIGERLMIKAKKNDVIKTASLTDEFGEEITIQKALDLRRKAAEDEKMSRVPAEGLISLCANDGNWYKTAMAVGEENRINEEEELVVEADGTTNWYKIAKSGKCEKCGKQSAHLEKDHRKPSHLGGKDEKSNWQFLCPACHLKKSKSENSFGDGGDDRINQLKHDKNKSFSTYQKETGEARVAKERSEIGEKAFSKLQSERSLARWHGKGKKKKK